MTYEDLKQKAKRLQVEGNLRVTLTTAERADWAYGNAVIENHRVTRQMAEKAVDKHLAEK
jgi:hypothetical protein